ncbi:long-chain fatty acid transport protein 4-like [Ornithodoros turicata]|uniref:long-chain-fatty-acid--CoA ligase n=1 Tax=Ornithodoros turicata TaxID=34597 RepID=A0A2R5LHS7_9ACAR
MWKLAGICGTFGALTLGSVCSAWTAAVVAFVVYVATGGWRFLRILIFTSKRDLTGLVRLIKTSLYFKYCLKNNRTIPKIFDKTVEKHADKVCFIMEHSRWTFRQVDEFTNRVANCFLEQGLKPGDEVAVFMDSRPEFVMTWLGLSRIGVVSALVNTNLKSDPLIHSLTCINAKAIIFGAEQANAMKDIAPALMTKGEFKYYFYGKCDSSPLPATCLDELLKDSSQLRPEIDFRGSIHDRLVYIYTSGTTGLPKAAVIKHSRYISMASAAKYMMPIYGEDIIYSALPLYHTAGGVLAVGQAIMYGNTVAIRPKFSASRFWDDCIKYDCTVTQYIGEICRYLLAQPSRPQEKRHKIRMMFGNGLRPQIWSEFAERFGVKDIRELYGSTEGNAHVLNIDNKVGSVGFVSRISSNVHPVKLIRVDENTGEPIRNEKGLCIPCEPDEVGELVGRIVRDDHIHSFDGYANPNATKKKVYKDVFKKGDTAFASGDLLVMDEFGYLFFKDRTGDTFRWKGENVSTSEVEGVIIRIVGLTDCAVYGVEVPGSEGKAGMAAICDPEHKTDLPHFLTEAKKSLPGYAIPLFIRFVSDIEATGTYKIKKVELQKEQFNIDIIKDPIFFLDLTVNEYVPLDRVLYEKIMNGQARV